MRSSCLTLNIHHNQRSLIVNRIPGSMNVIHRTLNHATFLRNCYWKLPISNSPGLCLLTATVSQWIVWISISGFIFLTYARRFISTGDESVSSLIFHHFYINAYEMPHSSAISQMGRRISEPKISYVTHTIYVLWYTFTRWIFWRNAHIYLHLCHYSWGNGTGISRPFF